MKSAIITFMLTIFIGPHLYAQYPDDQNLNAPVPLTQKGNYEDWCTVIPIPFDEPECWATSSAQCSALGLPSNVNLTEDANTGTFALVLETGMDSAGITFPAIASFKNVLMNRPEKITGYYKADLKGDDYSSIRVSLLSDRGMVGWGKLDITRSTNIYEHFEIPLHYISASVMPDSISLYIYSSYDLAALGTTLILDDIVMEALTDVAIPLTERFTTRVNPSPATDEIRVVVPKGLGRVTFIIYDNSGRIIENQVFEDETRINVSEMTAGLYFFEVRLQNHEIYDKGRFRVADHGL